MNIDYFNLFRPFLIAAMMLLAMWEPSRKRNRSKTNRQETRQETQALHKSPADTAAGETATS